MYEAEYHPKIRKDLKKIDPPIREKIRTEHIPNILADPGSGENLAGDLKGTATYHFSFLICDTGLPISQMRKLKKFVFR